MAGFWPEWWEYRKAQFGSRSELWWIGILKEIMQEYANETEADMDVEMYENRSYHLPPNKPPLNLPGIPSVKCNC